jgi:hypothetical protein
MSEFFTPQTGDDKMDEAYQNMQLHVSTFNDFNSFHNYFKSIVKTDDNEKLNKWLLKVLFVNLKQPNNIQHNFDKLLDAVDSDKKKQLQEWLETNLIKVGVNV